MYARLLGLAAALAVALGLSGPAFAAAAPISVIEKLNSTLLSVMQQADELGLEGRAEALSPTLKQSFDFEEMARVTVRRHWNALDNDQRDRLVKEFARLSIATMASRFDGYSGETFEVIEEVPHRQGNVLVRSQLNRPSDEPLGLSYLLHESNGRWQIIDVLLDDKYSELAIKRSEYTSVLSREGFEELLGRLKQQTERIGLASLQ